MCQCKEKRSGTLHKKFKLLVKTNQMQKLINNNEQKNWGMQRKWNMGKMQGK